MKNESIQLVPADCCLAEQVVDYYKRNKEFLEAFEPVRSEEFYTGIPENGIDKGNG